MERKAMLVERRRSPFPLELLVRVAIAWAFVATVLIAANWASISGPEALLSLTPLGCAMLLSARIAWRLMGEEEATLAALIPALTIPVLFEFSSSQIDHYEWQINLALVAVNALLSRRPTIGGWVIGATCAAWLVLSAEGLVFAGAIACILALRWVRNREARAWLIGWAQGIAVFALILSLALAVMQGTSLSWDSLGFGQIIAIAWVAVTVTLLGRFEPLPAGARLLGLGSAAAGAIGLALMTVPHVSVPSVLPIWQASVSAMLQYCVAPLIGIFAATNLANSSRDWLRRYWGDYALFLIAAFVFALIYTPAAAIACVLAAPPLAWQVREWLRRIRLVRPVGQRLVATLALAWALLPALPVIVLTKLA
ncbi:MAG: hypothetical protein AAFQ27_08110 [Pseudomonadota bacterium]